MKYIRSSLLLSALFCGSSIVAADFNLKEYALPQNSIRAKLDSIFLNNRHTRAIRQDDSWVDFKSWHWLVGKLTADDGTEFVIKTAKYREGRAIPNPDIPFLSQTHTAQQNISRISNTAEVNRIIQEKQLTKIRTANCWAYPLSGNDEDLNSPTITDREVIVVEEFIEPVSKQNTFCRLVNTYVQIEALFLDQEAFEQLVTLAQKGNVSDLYPKNILVDSDGNIVLIDLEDIVSRKREKSENSQSLLKRIKNFKFKQHEKGYALLCVGATGLSNKKHFAVKRRGAQIIARGLFCCGIKKNIFELAGLTAFGGTALLACHLWKKN